MKKLVLFFVALSFGLSSFGQLKVANNFGKDLYVSVAGNEVLIANKGVKTFANVRVRTVWLDCREADGVVKFSIAKEVSRSGVVEILSSDNSLSAAVRNQVSAVLPEPSQSLTNAVSTGQTMVEVPSLINQAAGKEQITIEYSGSRTLKVLSSDCRGLELIGRNDSAYSVNKNKYIIEINKNTELVLGVVEKRRSGQAIWPYGEIRKSIGLNDQICKITDNDVKMLCSSTNKKLKFKVDAAGYKILIETDASEIISLGDKGVSKTVEVPVGQSYIRIGFTDSTGEFHPTAFMPLHVTDEDRFIVIDNKSLAKKLLITNF